MSMIAFSTDGKFVASCNNSGGGGVEQLDAETGEIFWKSNKEIQTFYTVAISPDNKFIATGGEDGDVYVWDPKRSNSILMKIQTGQECLGAIVWRPGVTEGYELLSRDRVGQSCVWRLPSITENAKAFIKWIDGPRSLNVREANFKEAKELPPTDADLLKQHGTVNAHSTKQ